MRYDTTVIVKKSRLVELEKKERAHDDYLEALRALKSRAASIDLEARGIREQDLTAHVAKPCLEEYADGYRQALGDISLAILVAGQARHDQLVGS